MNRKTLELFISKHEGVNIEEINDEFIKNLDSLDSLYLETEMEKNFNFKFDSEYKIAQKTITEVLEDCINLINKK
jgi:hypothetical protein